MQKAVRYSILLALTVGITLSCKEKKHEPNDEQKIVATGSTIDQESISLMIGSWQYGNGFVLSLNEDGSGIYGCQAADSIVWKASGDSIYIQETQSTPPVTATATLLKSDNQNLNKLLFTRNGHTDTLWNSDFYDSLLVGKLSFWKNYPQEAMINPADISESFFAGRWLREWNECDPWEVTELAMSPIRIHANASGQVDTLYPCYERNPLATELFQPLPSTPARTSIKSYWSYNPENAQLHFWNVVDTVSNTLGLQPSMTKTINELYQHRILFADEPDPLEISLWVRYTRTRFPHQADIVPSPEFR